MPAGEIRPGTRRAACRRGPRGSCSARGQEDSSDQAAGCGQRRSPSDSANVRVLYPSEHFLAPSRTGGRQTGPIAPRYKSRHGGRLSNRYSVLRHGYPPALLAVARSDAMADLLLPSQPATVPEICRTTAALLPGNPTESEAPGL